MFWIFICYNCGNLLLAKTTQKTKVCPYCEFSLKLIKAKKIVQVKTAQEASRYIRAIKHKKNF